MRGLLLASTILLRAAASSAEPIQSPADVFRVDVVALCREHAISPQGLDRERAEACIAAEQQAYEALRGTDRAVLQRCLFEDIARRATPGSPAERHRTYQLALECSRPPPPPAPLTPFRY